jgi:putative ABC transport system permease protein
MSTPISIRLALRQWLARPLRPILCSLAIAAAVALIVCVGAGFDSLRYSLRTTIGQMLGVADVHVRPASKSSNARLPDSLLGQLRARPDVDFAAGRLQSQLAIRKPGAEKHWFDAVGVDPAWDEKLRPKKYTPPGGGHPLTGHPDEVVIDSGVAEAIDAHVNDSVLLSADNSPERKATVVGIAKRPAIEMITKPTIYLPLDVFAKELRIAPQYNVIDVKFKDSVKIDDYDAYAEKLEKQLGKGVHVSAGTNSKAKLAQETRSIQIILSLLATISAICAALIIGTTLSVGVQERIRQFGQLRCIGASRSQLVAFLLGDALVMLALGEIIGIILGFALSRALVWYFPQFFLEYLITASSITIAVVDGCLATLLGAIIPIWQVTRVTPMAAVSNVARRADPRRVWLVALAGILCFALQVALWRLIPDRDTKFWVYMLLGAPLIFFGFALLGPALLTVCEVAGAQIIGRLLFVRPALLRNSWSATPWRAGAMIAALMIGVTLFTTVRARGQSLLASWVSPARLPDLLMYSPIDMISLIPSSILPEASRRAEVMKEQHPEISEITAVTSYSVKIKTNFTKGGEITNVDGPHFVAVDPPTFGKLVEMEYFQGDPKIALQQLAAGGHIFVTKEFYNLRGLGVGDKLTLLASNGKPVTFTIAAVVTSTGMELVKNYFDMRSVFQDHALTSVLGSVTDAHKYFKARAGTLMLANIKPGTTPAAVAKLKNDLLQEGYQSVSSLELKNGIRNIIVRVVETLSVIALGALIVASLGVANMVIASVHARRFEFGVLRAIGAGRGQLIRLVLAEVTLIGVVAGILGAAAGLFLAFMATQIDQLLIGFQTKFLAAQTLNMLGIVALHLLIAIALTTLLAWLASAAPAIRGAFSAQRTLLASGRG